MKWRAYPAYKDSGVEWLGKIPKHWESKRLRFACDVNPRKSEAAYLSPETQVSFVPMEDVGEDGTFVLNKTRALEDVWQGYTYFRDRDVVVAKITPCFENGKGTLFDGLVNGIGFGTTEFHVLRARQDVDPKFVFYLTRSQPFRTNGAAMMYGAAGQQRVPEDFVKDFVAGFSPLSEQRAIAAFLDCETGRIDALIAKKERQIELLQEKRAALISYAVTKGLDPDAPMKDSGIGWLGEIPAHWTTKRLKFVTSFVTSGSRGWAQYYSDDGAIFLRIGNLSRESIDLDLDDIQHVCPPSGSEGERTRVRKNDVLVSITAYIGSVGIVSEDIDAYVNQHIALTRPLDDQVYPRWLSYCLLSQVNVIKLTDGLVSHRKSAALYSLFARVRTSWSNGLNRLRDHLPKAFQDR